MLRKIGCIFAGFTLCLLLAGCQTGAQQGYNAPYNSATLNTQDYIQLANITAGSQKEHYRLLAAKRALQNHQTDQAQKIITQINPSFLPNPDQYQLQLMRAQIDITKHEYDKALDALAQLNQPATLNTTQQWQLHQLAGESYLQKGNLLASIEQYDAMFPLTENNQSQKDVAKIIWHNLQNQNKSTLQSLKQQTNNLTTTGWLELASLSKENSLTPPELLQALNQWQVNFPMHPGSVLINKSPSSNEPIAQLPKNIALLLPLTGRLSKEAKAIQDGFFSAYYATQNEGFNPTITLYNTENKNILDVYKQAKTNGADFVVGPLTKSNVQALIDSDEVTIPTLALNRVDTPIEKSGLLFEFGLSPIDEMEQGLSRLWQENHYRILVIAPNNQWGQKIVNHFEQKWADLGGHITKTILYQNRKNLSYEIRQALNINQTEARKHALEKCLHKQVRFLPRRRKDFDAIFIISNNTFARQIVPLLKFYFAGDIPIYSMPDIYLGNTNTRRDHDLNNVIFNHMPWDLSSDQNLTPMLKALRSQAKTSWPKSFQHHKRLMALGIDAYLLIPKLGKLILLPQFGIAGATGTLYLLPNHHIYRKLDWAQFKNGRAKNLNSIT